MQATHKIFAYGIILSAGAITAYNSASAAGTVGERIKNGLTNAGTASGYTGSGAQSADLATLIGNLINQGFGILGVLLLGLMLYGGFMWMTAAGDTEKVKKSVAIIRNAIIGLVIIVLAYALSNFVIMTLSNATTGGTGGTGGTGT